jgi:phospholipase/carboxylesterase
MTDDLPLAHVSRPPRGGDDDRPPAVILLHGRGADEEDLLPLAGDLPESLHVLSARAPDRLGMGYTWYDLDLSGGGLAASQPDAEGFLRSLDALHEFVDAAVEAYDLDPDRVGLLGFSQGAILSVSALVERPERYAWMAALHGYLAASHDDREALEGAADRPVFVGCGRQDQVIPAERARRAAETLTDAGLDVTFREYGVGHGTSPEEVSDVTAWIAARLE